jgi:Eukaryotic protein of unknown function (DUF846)
MSLNQPLSNSPSFNNPGPILAPIPEPISAPISAPVSVQSSVPIPPEQPTTLSPSAPASSSAPPDSDPLKKIFAVSSHPKILMVNFLFKISSIFVYWFFYWITGWYTGTFILTTISLALDFWVTKNLSGRFLAGLRWWSVNTDEGMNEFLFESSKDNINTSDLNVFWMSLYGFTGYWIAASIFNLLTLNFNNLTICLIGSFFSFTNLTAFRQCCNINILKAVPVTSAAPPVVASSSV